MPTLRVCPDVKRWSHSKEVQSQRWKTSGVIGFSATSDLSRLFLWLREIMLEGQMGSSAMSRYPARFCPARCLSSISMHVVGKGCSGDLSDTQGQILQCHEPFFLIGSLACGRSHKSCLICWALDESLCCAYFFKITSYQNIEDSATVSFLYDTLRTHFLIHCSVLRVQPIGPSHTLATGSQQGLGEWLLLHSLRANFYQFLSIFYEHKAQLWTFPYIFFCIMFQHFLGILERARGAYKDSLPVSLWFESIFRSPWSNGAGDNGAMENVLWFVYLVN